MDVAEQDVDAWFPVFADVLVYGVPGPCVTYDELYGRVDAGGWSTSDAAAPEEEC